MPIEIVRNDITKMHTDAIVNAANESLLGGGGVDGAIHRAAGPELLAECRTLGGCRTGEAKITKGYLLPCRYVIHTVGPVWHGGACGEDKLLRSCYRNALLLARKHKCTSIAFPLISSGIYGYPKDQALRIATDTIRDFLFENDEQDMHVYIVIFDKESLRISAKLYTGIKEYIDDHYVEARFEPRRLIFSNAYRAPDSYAQDDIESDGCVLPAADSAAAKPYPASLEDALSCIDESFSEMVLRMIDKKGMTDPECYKKANLDRKLFSKLRKDKGYKPKKQTALALAIALELSLYETNELLMKAGFALSPSDKADIIIEYFIENGNYDIFEVNAALYSFDQVPLGGKA